MWVKKEFRSGCTKDKCACKERMWVRVKSVRPDGTIVGQLQNEPRCHPLKWGTRVEVNPEEIVNITVGEDAATKEPKLFIPRGTVPRAPTARAPKAQVNWTTTVKGKEVHPCIVQVHVLDFMQVLEPEKGTLKLKVRK